MTAGGCWVSLPSAKLTILAALWLTLSACSHTPPSTPQPSNRSVAPSAPAQSSADGSLAPLFSRPWRITTAPTQPAAGSIYVFLPNGTLLETSCVETYRIAAWSLDKDSPRELRVVEDRQPAFTAQIEELTDTTLRLQKRLTRSKETQAVTLNAVEGEFVCPDMPK
jgi:hypothetical protein